MVEFPDAHAAESADAHLLSQGVIVRRIGDYGLPGMLRISIGTRREMEICLDALRLFVREAGS